jgi:hypothetical protein
MNKATRQMQDRFLLGGFKKQNAYLMNNEINYNIRMHADCTRNNYES